MVGGWVLPLWMLHAVSEQLAPGLAQLGVSSALQQLLPPPCCFLVAAEPGLSAPMSAPPVLGSR